MKYLEERSYNIQLNMFFLTAFGVILAFFSMCFTLFTFLDTMPKNQTKIEISTVRAIEGSLPTQVEFEVKDQSELRDKTTELASWHAEQMNKRSKNQNLRGALIQHRKSPIFTLSHAKVRPPQHTKSPSIIRFKSNRS